MTDRNRIRTYSLKDRKSKVNVSRFGRTHRVGDSVRDLLEKLPGFLGAKDLLEVARAVVEARAGGRSVMMAFGAHVIKVGVSPLIIDLLEAGLVTSFATNGAGMIHDFEIAYVGHTSEDVDATLGSGTFGFAEETGAVLNGWINDGVADGLGLGESVGKALVETEAPFREQSLLARSYELGAPMSIHVALGTDVNHIHPAADGAKIGAGSLRDFSLFCDRVSHLDGGVYINLGSAVLLPEVFLKAVTLARNTGVMLNDITTLNMDFIQHYRPMTNVVRRPTAQNGKGYALTGHHEIMAPLLCAAVKEEAARQGIPTERTDNT